MMWALWSCLLIIAAADVAAATLELEFEEIASFVTVDYLWGENRSRSLYEESGQFLPANNAITGIKVSKSGDIFVTVPRWMTGVPSSLNKLVTNPNGPGYVLDPWPSWGFNAIGTGVLQYAQSMLIDSQNRMWIPEVGRTNFYDANPALATSGPAGVLLVDASTGQLLAAPYYFPDDVVPYNNSFVNDIVLDEATGYAYFTNTYADGGIIVYDSVRRQSHMFVAECTQRNASYDFCVNGNCYGTDGVGSSPSDGIALSTDGAVLYFSPVQGNGLYAINTSFLQNFDMTNAQFQENVEFLGFKTGCSDGMLIIKDRLYYGNIQDSSLGELDNLASYYEQSKTTDVEGTQVLDPSDSSDSYSSVSTLNWIDTFAIDFNNSDAFYFSTNKLNLFVSPNAMDFTGQSGSNFQLFHAVPSKSSSSAAAKATTVTLALHAVATVAVISFTLAVF